MVQAREGRIVTFYSFKGGTGRTMALANVAWLLASSGMRVLTVDWDLESPGLPRYFNPFLPAEAVRDAPGVIDLIREFDTEAARRRRRGETLTEIAGYAQVKPYAMSLNWSFPNGGGLDFMSSGRQNMDYATTIGSLGWDTFYERLGGGRLFDALRADMKENYDYTLIDSRTGFGDISDICVKHLPDTLVNCFTLNTQGIEGAVRVAVDLLKYQANGTGKRIRVLPVPMRVDDGEKGKADTGRALARRRFDGLPSDLPELERQTYWSNVEIPYRPFYAYEEILAAFGDENAGPTNLLGAYERLTRYITEGEVSSAPPIEAELRQRWLKQFERSAPSTVSRILLDYRPGDEAWAEWIGRVLGSVGVTAMSLSEAGRTGQDGGAEPLVLSVYSRLESGAPGLSEPSAREDEQDREDRGARRVLYVSDVDPFARIPAGVSESVAGQPAEEAARRLTRLVGCDPVREDALPALAEHYPDNVPTLDNTLSRNPRFTGRTELLLELRDKLRTHRRTAVIPDKLPSGVGKTQLALEYVHRYKSEYDVIWWIESGQPQFVDTTLVDLGRSLNAGYGSGIAIDAGGSAQDDAVVVANALAQGRPVKRWLLVFDNAPEPKDIRKYIPGGQGHVLITSRSREWAQTLPSSLEVGVFSREESIAHVRWRASSVSAKDANSLAEALGDLPVAISLTGAWLSETGTDVPEYIRRLDERGPMAIPESPEDSPLDGYSDKVIATFDNSLDRARELSEAAHRLLELCSFLSEGSISTALVYTPAMLDLLSEFDKKLAEPVDIARHVQLLNRLALIKLDNQTRQFTIHRLLHARIRQRLSAEDYASVRHQVHLLLQANRPRRSVDDPDTWSRFRMLWPHLDPSDAAACGDERVRSLMIDRVRYIWAVGSLPETSNAARVIERRWQSMIEEAPEDEDTRSLRTQLLHLQFNIANVLRDEAKYDEAWQLDTKVLKEQRELLGNEHRHTLMTAGGHAADLRALGKYQEALEEAEETYTTWTEVYGGDHERTLAAANNLAVSYRLVGRYTDARVLDEETYRQRRAKDRTTPSPDTIRSAIALGRDLREAGRRARGGTQPEGAGPQGHRPGPDGSSSLAPRRRPGRRGSANLQRGLRDPERAARPGTPGDADLPSGPVREPTGLRRVRGGRRTDAHRAGRLPGPGGP
jgi:tetratricopeptide (TPR) repeat protein